MALQQALIERAAEISGGLGRLGDLLGADAALLARWRVGYARLPEPVFLKLVDIVLTDDVARARVDRRQHARTHALPDPFFPRLRRARAIAD